MQRRKQRAPGKGVRFPIAGEYVFEPADAPSLDELDAIERPLLLHPFRGPDPLHHLAFNEFGDPIAIDESPYGEASINVFALDREALRTARSKRFKDMRLIIKKALDEAFERDTPFAETIDDYLATNPEYSAARRDYAWWEYEREKSKHAAQLHPRLR